MLLSSTREENVVDYGSYRGKRITIYSIASINYLIGTKRERRKKRDNDVAHALKCMKEGNGASYGDLWLLLLS